MPSSTAEEAEVVRDATLSLFRLQLAITVQLFSEGRRNRARRFLPTGCALVARSVVIVVVAVAVVGITGILIRARRLILSLIQVRRLRVVRPTLLIATLLLVW